MRGNTEFTDDVVFPALQELLGLPEAADFPLSRFRHLTAVARPRTTTHAARLLRCSPSKPSPCYAMMTAVSVLLANAGT